MSKVRRQINPPLRIDGILMTMVMPRTNISKEITATVRSAYGQKIKTDRLNALNIELNLDEKDTSVMDTEPEQTEEQPERKAQDREH